MLVKATGFLLKAKITLLFYCTLVCTVLVGDRTPPDLESPHAVFGKFIQPGVQEQQLETV